MTGQSVTAHDPVKRERIIASAAMQFSRVGFERAGVDTIASGAGVAKGTIYLYFHNKADLFGAVLTELRDRIETSAASDQTEDPELILREVVRAQLKVAAAAPDLFRCYVSALFGVNRDFQTAALAIFASQQEGVVAVLRRQAHLKRNTRALKRRASLFLASILAAALLAGLGPVHPRGEPTPEDALMALVAEPSR